MDFESDALARLDTSATEVSDQSVDSVIDITDAALEARQREIQVPQQRASETDPLELIPTLPSTGTLEERIRRAPLSARPASPWADALRRIADVTLSLLLLIVFSPVMLVIALVIRLDSPGPAIYRQDRVARGGGTFRFAKFRTMYVDSRERFPELFAFKYTTAEIRSMKYKLADDPRLTRMGRWMRRASFDELPNLFCVLRGDLTLVGPRPELPQYVDYYEPHQLAKFSVKPGLTGLAQTCGRDTLTVQETIAADLDYVRRRSLALDARIFARTVWLVIAQRGAF